MSSHASGKGGRPGFTAANSGAQERRAASLWPKRKDVSDRLPPCDRGGEIGNSKREIPRNFKTQTQKRKSQRFSLVERCPFRFESGLDFHVSRLAIGQIHCSHRTLSLSHSHLANAEIIRAHDSIA